MTTATNYRAFPWNIIATGVPDKSAKEDRTSSICSHLFYSVVDSTSGEPAQGTKRNKIDQKSANKVMTNSFSCVDFSPFLMRFRSLRLNYMVCSSKRWRSLSSCSAFLKDSFTSPFFKDEGFGSSITRWILLFVERRLELLPDKAAKINVVWKESFMFWIKESWLLFRCNEDKRRMTTALIVAGKSSCRRHDYIIT